MRVAVIGSGYVGLVSGACFADFGHAVACVDKDPGEIDMLRRGGPPIFEPGLAGLVSANERAGRLVEGVACASDPYGCAEGADALVIVTEWDASRALDLGRIRSLMRAPVLVDLRDIDPPDEVARNGFVHEAVGRAR